MELFCGILLLVINNNHTHFSIFNKENIERDEDAEVEDVNVVLDSHLQIGQKGGKQHFFHTIFFFFVKPDVSKPLLKATVRRPEMTLITEREISEFAGRFQSKVWMIKRCSETIWECFSTCRLLSGSIFMTGPMVLRGKETSMLWFGISGV